MPNKIVQLIDNEDNNIYPVAGSLAQGSVTTSTINDGAVTAAKVDFRTMPGNYSTSEVDTGYTWVDGSTIYKKTVNFGSLPNSTAKSVNNNISGMDYLVSFDGIITNGTSFLPLNMARTDSPLTLATYCSKTQISIETNSDRTAFTAYVTLYYTKTS